MKRILILLAGVFWAVQAWGQQDTLAHEFTVTSSMWSRGEYRDGGMPDDNGRDNAVFISARTLLNLNYKYKALEVKVAPAFYGVWGAKGGGGFSMDEAWFSLRSKTGLFAQLGRQKLRYDDQRIIGDNDWAMVVSKHDVLRAGFENDKHKVHVILAFNQNDENTNGGTFYVDGGQPYKAMETLWYHWDPVPQFGASLIFINTGMQNLVVPELNKTEQQQLFGAFLDWHPKDFSLQAAYYRQTGKNEYCLPICAWMASAEASWDINRKWNLRGGYYFMSGDESYFTVKEGEIGMAEKTSVHGFNPIFGSHHQFYGAMEFFYVKTFYGGNAPGLQDLHVGGEWKPVSNLSLELDYHFLATAVAIEGVSKTLGHELELEASWTITKNVTMSAGYSWMRGTKTMDVLKRKSNDDHLTWAWLMLTVNPEFFNKKW